MSAYYDAKFQVRRIQRKQRALESIRADLQDAPIPYNKLEYPLFEVRTNSIGEKQVVPSDLLTKIGICVRENKRALLKGGVRAGIPCLELDLQKLWLKAQQMQFEEKDL